MVKHYDFGRVEKYFDTEMVIKDKNSRRNKIIRLYHVENLSPNALSTTQNEYYAQAKPLEHNKQNQIIIQFLTELTSIYPMNYNGEDDDKALILSQIKTASDKIYKAIERTTTVISQKPPIINTAKPTKDIQRKQENKNKHTNKPKLDGHEPTRGRGGR